MSELALSHDENDPKAALSASTLPNKTDTHVDMHDLSMDAFWKTFHVFSSPFEEFCFRRWYVLLGVFFSSLLLSNVIIDLNAGLLFQHNMWFYFTNYPSFTNHPSFNCDESYPPQLCYFTARFLTSWGYNLFVIGMFLVLLVFYNWQKSIPDFFQALQQKRILYDSHRESPGVSKDYQKFLDEYQSALLHGKKYNMRLLVTVGIMIVEVIALALWWILFNIQDLSYIVTHYNLLIAVMFGIQNVVRETIYTLLMVYLIVQALWILTTTGSYLSRLTSQFGLLIQPGNADHCGGLKFLGDFALKMALVMLMTSILLAFYSTAQGFSFWSIGSSLGLIVFITLAYFVFFAPLMNIHQKMLEKRSTYEEAFANSMAKIAEKISIALTEGDVAKIKAAKEDAEMIQALHPDKIGFSTWPLNRSTLLAFLTPQIVPFIGIVVGLTPPVADALKGVFSIFSGGK
jgi:hypothetical protein